MWAIGDILMATPMIDAIRTKEPDAHIAWLVDVKNAEVLENHPGIDEVIVIDSGHWRRLRRRGNLIAWAALTAELHGSIKRRQFDAVINCQAEDWWSRFLCPAPVRVGVAWSIKTRWRHWYTHFVVKQHRGGLHNTDHFLQATTILGFPPASKRMTIGETPDEASFFEDFVRRNGIDTDRPMIVIAPFSTAENRSLEPALMAQVADWLDAEYGAKIVVTAGPGDKEKARAIVDASTRASIVVAEGTGLREYISILRHADLIVTGDSSPMHLAAALGTPYVALFGPTPVNERAPFDSKGHVIVKPIPCSPCDLSTCSNKVFKECMKLIELADIQKAVRDMVAEYGVFSKTPVL